MKQNISKGNRNTFIYNLAVFAYKLYPNNKDKRNALIEEGNIAYCNPALPSPASSRSSK